MNIDRRALYNLLRMNWLHDPKFPYEEWQVADYRAFPLETLFANLEEFGVSLDQDTFVVYAEAADSPEELTEQLLGDGEREREPEEQDKIYLLLFELWRRLVPEKLSLSLFCDELDHQIFKYDQGDPSGAEAIQDTIANLQVVLDENVDEGGNPSEIFALVSEACANDLESFLYDFIAEQMDTNNVSYATELLDGFDSYLEGNKWFDLLRVRVWQESDREAAQEKLRKLAQKAVKEDDLPYNLELLSVFAQCGEKGEFNKMVKKTLPLLQSEEDFRELLSLCSDYFRCLDEDQKEQAILNILQTRDSIAEDHPIESDDPGVAHLLKVIK